MEIGSNAFQSGIQGFNKAQQRIEQAANTIAQGSENTDLETAAVNLLQGENEAAANAKSIATANETLGTLLDINA